MFRGWFCFLLNNGCEQSKLYCSKYLCRHNLSKGWGRILGEVNSLFVQLNAPNGSLDLFSIMDDCNCLTLRVKIQRGNEVSYLQR